MMQWKTFPGLDIYRQTLFFFFLDSRTYKLCLGVEGPRNVKMFYMLCYAKSLQSCPTLCDPIDGSPPGSPVPGILQARTMEWAAISFSNA